MSAYVRVRTCPCTSPYTAAPHPIIFNSFVGLGVVVSSICVMPFLHLLEADLKFNPLGSLSGHARAHTRTHVRTHARPHARMSGRTRLFGSMLFVGATLFSFLAIPRLGLAIAQA